MIHTVEIRWFFEGRLPAAVLDWYSVRGPAAEQPPRTDTYLCLPGCHSCGVKLREGRLEIKAVTAQAGDIQLAEGISAPAEGWVKWGTAPAGGRGIDELVRFDSSDRLVHVQKRRYLRWYDFDVSAAPTGSMPLEFGEVCQVELSALHAGFSAGGTPGPESAHSDWWSLCFEAGSRRGRGVRNLAAAGAREFAVRPPLRLDGVQAMGYPAWLDGLGEAPAAGRM